MTVGSYQVRVRGPLAVQLPASSRLTWAYQVNPLSSIVLSPFASRCSSRAFLGVLRAKWGECIGTVVLGRRRGSVMVGFWAGRRRESA